MEAKRSADKAGRTNPELRRLAKFYQADRPPRKRLRTLLEFLRTPSGTNDGGNIAVAVTSLLTGANKDGNASGGMTPADFWADMANSGLVFQVLDDCVTELESFYTPHENAFRKARKKNLEQEDWSEVFEGLEALIRNNTQIIHEGWNALGFTQFFLKLLRRDNHAIIKKYAFRCLALFTDATRDLKQLQSMPTTPLPPPPQGGAGIVLGSEGDVDSDEEDRGSAPMRKTMHLELLRESVDFSPYGGGNILLPDRFINEGVHVEGWMRPTPTQAEEPVDMLKFLMDLSLEKEDASVLSNNKIDHRARGERFLFWCELIMKFYMPILYPKVCIRVKLKDEADNLGFFHHCPGSFQRVVARWLYKLRSKDALLETLWGRREFSEVVMETIRQRFAYRDAELVLDAVRFYSAICSGSQYIPSGMKAQMNETSRAMISHTSQLFHPSVQLEDTKVLLPCIELLELISQRSLDDYTSTYLRKFVVSTIDNCMVLRETGNTYLLSAMLSVVFHVWMHAAVASNAVNAQTWIELTVSVRRWLVGNGTSKVVAIELVHCWKRELRFASCLLMSLLDTTPSEIKMTSEGAELIATNAKDSKTKDTPVKQGYVQSASRFLQLHVGSSEDATLLLDRVLHLIPPSTVENLPPYLRYILFEGMLQLSELWIDSAICCERSTATALHRIGPSTVIALFGEWFLPACEMDASDFQQSRCLAIVILCKLCAVRSLNTLTHSHAVILSRVLFKGISSPSGVVVSTVLQRASKLFTLNLEGMNTLVPPFLHVIDQIIVGKIWDRADTLQGRASEWSKELNASLDILFSILSLPKRFPLQDFVNWRRKVQAAMGNDESAMTLLDEVPETRDAFHVIIGRVLVRVIEMPFTDIPDIKKKALWGLYLLVVSTLTNTHANDTSKVSDWILRIVDACSSSDFSISATALSVLQDLADYHDDIQCLEPALSARIVMSLAVMAQQQVEEASIEVQTAIESLDTSDVKSDADDPPPARRTNDENDALSKLRSKLRNNSTPSSASTPTTASPKPTSKTQDIPALRQIVHKTDSIFECLRFWVMRRPDVLYDADVKKLLFSAIEAALLGTLPDGDWQRQVEKARTLERRNSLPLLFLGLQMRESLSHNASASWLKYFEETAIAAEGLLMHLLHHLHNFPSPAGVDQMTSNCVEVDEEKAATFSFVFMDSLIVSVVGSIDAPTARFIVRDMTGLFSWAIAPAVSYETRTQEKTEVKKSTRPDAVSSLHTPEASVRLDFVHAKDGSNVCRECQGDRTTNVKGGQAKVVTKQTPIDKEKRILDNSICSTKSSYAFHDTPKTEEEAEKEPETCVCRLPTEPITTVCGLFDMDLSESNVGNLDGERGLLDLLLDSVPMVYRDCGGDTTDKTLLGGRYSLLKYNWMDLQPSSSPTSIDSTDVPGFSFLQRLVHDEECYAQLKSFLLKDATDEQKDVVEFIDGVKKFERSTIATDRLGQASVMFWEFFSAEGAKSIFFPRAIASDIREKMRQAKKTLDYDQVETFALEGALFQHAMAHIEQEFFEKKGWLDKFVEQLDSNASGSRESMSSVPPQLSLFDNFSVMELNARIVQLALSHLNSDDQHPAIAPSYSSESLFGSKEGQTGRVNSLDMCRLFLSQTGMLPAPDGDAKHRKKLKLLESGARLDRSLAHLDKSPTRETMKIGVIYVDKQQTTQQEILQNDCGSRAYAKFLTRLGWDVDLLTHRGFAGGLDCNPSSLSNGQHALYYADSHSEVVFHVVTKMPTKAGDLQQIDKKRHVGNDYVHVVWSDNVAHAYNPATITSHFNDVQIVIYPLRRAQKGLYLIHIYSKDKVPSFGPLQSGMVVHETDLARLVRQTAMNANRVCRSQTNIYTRPYPTRKKLVNEIMERYAVEYKESELLTSLFSNESAMAASGASNE